MNSSNSRAVWLEIDTSNKEATIADAINNWCSSNPNVQIYKIDVYREHEVKYKALIIYST